MAMFNPAHPGEILRELYLDGLGLSITEAAKGLGVSRKALSELVNGKAGVSPLMAMRLSIAFPNTSPQFWLNLQNQYDLWRERDNRALVSVRVFQSTDTRPEGVSTTHD